ncbi:hypothetical protein MMC17_006046 [Xylographa soralifera]|nr:hypothetical protein [Xylographa soralifera]
MSSTFKGSFGKKSNAASDMAPPSYATRPPKNHQKASSTIDSEEDDEVMPPNTVDRGRSKQVYDIDSDEEEAPAQSERPRTRARSHGGRDKIDHNRADAHGKQRSRHDSGRRGTSQALVRREPSLSDEEPVPSRGHRGANKSKALTTRGHGGRQTAHEEETISIERFRVVTWKQMAPSDRRLVADNFEISLGQLKNYCDDGKIRMDNKLTRLDYELMYPLFPPHIVNRVKNEIEAYNREDQKMKNQSRKGRTIIETRFVVPAFVPHNPYLEPYHEPYLPPYLEQYHEPYLEEEDWDERYGSNLFNTRSSGGRRAFGFGSPWSHDPLNANCLCWECEL